MEIEYKYYLPKASDMEKIQCSPFFSSLLFTPWKSEYHHARYYSDEKNSIINQGFVIRTRLEEDTHILTLKREFTHQSTSNRSVRIEYNFPWNEYPPTFQDLIVLLDSEDETKERNSIIDTFIEFSDFQLFAKMESICTRVLTELHLNNMSCTLSMDEGILKVGSQQEKVQELELEYLTGDISEFDCLANKIHTYFQLNAQTESKFARLLEMLKKVEYIETL